MPAAVIRQADADRIAAALKARGRPIPAGLQPASGKPATTPAVRPAPAKRAPAPRTRPPAGHAAPPATAPPPARRQRRSGGMRRGRRAGRPGGGLLSIGGGDGGGLLLAFWAYPLVLSLIKYGAKGPGMWLRAKFLNIDTTPGAASATPAPVGKTPSTGKAPTPGSPISPAAQGLANSLGKLMGAS